MPSSKHRLYRFPWSPTDNPGGWVEVTDECDLACPGCYRHRLEGHRPLGDVLEEIVMHKRFRNCDRIAIAGGEPLLYPHIVKVVEFIARQQMKPMILTNGHSLTWERAVELKRAGLKQFYFHVDSGQNRPGWMGKTEAELNVLRQHFADLCWDLQDIQCGYNTTIFRSTLSSIPDIVRWCRANVHKVQHLSLIAFRALPVVAGVEYMVNGEPIDLARFKTISTSVESITISTDDMLAVVQEHFPDLHPCAYLNGTTTQQIRKFLVVLPLGSKREVFGSVGAKTVELDAALYHLRHGRYAASLANPEVGKKIFVLALFDPALRIALGSFLKSVVRNPLRLFDRLYVQAINLQQPNEYVNGVTNLCEGCVNMMLYKGKWIHSCRLDEYRLFGGPITAVVKDGTSKDLAVNAVPFG